MKHLRGAGLLGTGLLAVALAGSGEAVIRSKNFSGLGGALYLLGILLFSVGAWPLPSTSEESAASAPGAASTDQSPGGLPASGERRGTWWRGGMLLVVAAVLAIGVDAVMLSRLAKANESPTTVLLWLLGPALLLLGGVLAGPSTAHAPRWRAAAWPRTRAGRAGVVVILLLLAVIAALSRFPGLDRVPFGINADEGDRAAVAIQIVRGQ